MDSNLNIKWQNYFYSTYSNLHFNLYIFATKDGGAIVHSWLSDSQNNTKYYTFKEDSLGNLPLGVL